MPPAKGKKTVTVAEKAIEAPSHAKPGTPEGSPQKQQSTVSEAQKQALVDNLQLEITERARKLRATYALHTQGLRSRLEMRINRIPQSLRSTNILELIDKYSEDLDPPKPHAKPLLSKPLPDPPTLNAGSRPNTATSSSPSRSLKRSSDHFTSDKENMTADLENPKKRSRTAAAPPTTRAGRAASRQINPASVLSPKSHNSRTLRHSPLRPPPSSPPKSLLGRPASPTKSAASMAPPALPSASAASTRTKAPARTASKQTKTNYAANAGTVRGKRGVPAAPEPRQPRSSDGSHASESSNGTTIVTKAASAKRGIVKKVTGMATGAKKIAARKEPEPTAATGRNTRALRSRK